MSGAASPGSGAEERAPPVPPERVPGLLRRSRAIGRWKRIGRIVGGSVCLVIGVIGGFLPILQGWIFIGLGIALLAPVVPPARRAMVSAFRRWPRLRRAVPRRYRRSARMLEDDAEEDPVVETVVDTVGESGP